MKLKTEPSTFQDIVLVVWLCIHMVVCNIVWNSISGPALIKSKDWMSVIIYAGIMIAVALLISSFLQFIFGLPWFSVDSDEAHVAEAFHYLGDEYRPSTAGIHALLADRSYYVELHLTLSVSDLVIMLRNSSDRRSGLNYFLLFEGDFPFARDTQTLYLTRAALRQIRQFSRRVFTVDDVRDYVQFDFDLTIPYYGRESPIFDRYYLLSRWDLREIRQILDASDLDLCSFFSSIGDLTLTSEDLAMYSSWLEHTPRDTFVAAIPEDEEAEEEEEQEEESNE